MSKFLALSKAVTDKREYIFAKGEVEALDKAGVLTLSAFIVDMVMDSKRLAERSGLDRQLLEERYCDVGQYYPSLTKNAKRYAGLSDGGQAPERR